MVELPNVTLVFVTYVYIYKSIKSLKYSKKGIIFNSSILFTDKELEISDISVIKIPKLDYIGYSHFIVYELYKYIKTDYVLIIQSDGFVINPQMWDNNFFNYDYIGAPFPIPKLNDKISYRDPFDNLIRVGNGGFSFRSKKLLSLASELNLPWKSYHGFWNEDGFYCVHNRFIYENNGCVFAPIDVAVKFSIENDVPESLGIMTFGFHGKHNLRYQLL
jgi:hypothetical protein